NWMNPLVRRGVGFARAASAALVLISAPASWALADPTAGTLAPNESGMMDCNGHSPLYASVRVSSGALCADPLSIYDGAPTRFVDNGHYVGHDEPSVKFISSAPGSGNHMTYFMRLG